ncbi:MAG: dephospho-CoA kinase [Pirellulales bacterium]|nr:dephospho-CoA kinase [Pirellulales bacterium]
MKVIGLLGGIASGKSFVAELFRQRGAVVLDGDRAGHEVLRDKEVKQAVRQRWGDKVFGPDGEIDRGALAKKVFAPRIGRRETLSASPSMAVDDSLPRQTATDSPSTNPTGELEYLERLTHPRIAVRLAQQVRAAVDNCAPAVVVDAAVMIKAGWDALCDTLVFVDAPREVRLQRARQRGWTEEEFGRREAAQESLDEKRARADVIIDNAGSPDDTSAQVEQFWHALHS